MPRKPKATNPEPCPNCGHCPTCGHTPQRMAPVYPWYPAWYQMPYYPSPWWGVQQPYVTSGYLTTDTTTTWYNLDSGAGGTC